MVVQLLLEKGADVEAKDNVSRTLLLYTAKNRNKAIIKLLLTANRVHIDSKDYYNPMPLSVAARIGYRDVVTFLLIESRILNTQDSYSQTPL